MYQDIRNSYALNIFVKKYKTKKEIEKFCWILLVEVHNMNEVIETENIKIEDMIYEVRGKQVMLDSEISRTKWHDKEY